MDLLQNISYYWTKQLDPRVVDLPLVASSYQIPLIICAYLYFVLVCGPRFMKNRPPYSLKTFIKLYNIVQILGNMWLIYDQIDAGLFSYQFVCPVIHFSYDFISMRFSRCIWYFLLLKIFDYVETGIFVLRKKNNQISTLHLYHHVSTLLFAWIGTRYYAVAPLALVCLCNCLIHILMYTYYFLAACGPSFQTVAAPMKQWITIAQMIQFSLVILYVLHFMLIPDCKNCIECSESNWILIIFIGNVIINFYMFYDFYRKTYKKLKKYQ